MSVDLSPGIHPLPKNNRGRSVRSGRPVALLAATAPALARATPVSAWRHAADGADRSSSRTGLFLGRFLFDLVLEIVFHVLGLIVDHFDELVERIADGLVDPISLGLQQLDD